MGCVQSTARAPTPLPQSTTSVRIDEVCGTGVRQHGCAHAGVCPRPRMVLPPLVTRRSFTISRLPPFAGCSVDWHRPRRGGSQARTRLGQPHLSIKLGAAARTRNEPPAGPPVSPDHSSQRLPCPVCPAVQCQRPLGHCTAARSPPHVASAPALPACRDCKCLDTPDEQRFDSITTLLKDMFQVGRRCRRAVHRASRFPVPTAPASAALPAQQAHVSASSAGPCVAQLTPYPAGAYCPGGAHRCRPPVVQERCRHPPPPGCACGGTQQLCTLPAACSRRRARRVPHPPCACCLQATACTRSATPPSSCPAPR